jgi:hypothetical protein
VGYRCEKVWSNGFKGVDVNVCFAQQSLELTIFKLQLSQTAGFRGINAPVLGPPLVERASLKPYLRTISLTGIQASACLK